MSQRIGQWSVGSHAEWKGPFGSFTYQPNKVVKPFEFFNIGGLIGQKILV